MWHVGKFGWALNHAHHCVTLDVEYIISTTAYTHVMSDPPNPSPLLSPTKVLEAQLVIAKANKAKKGPRAMKSKKGTASVKQHADGGESEKENDKKDAIQCVFNCST